ncbi:MAG: hypothetical protein U9N49_10540 [Campylobacterota bacterium]|nr:hypothetical protein [Campylobacterota bacterium]
MKIKKLEQKIHKAIDNNRLKLIEGEKFWYSYFLSIQELVWARNNHDGYLIDVYDKKDNLHLLRMTI